MKIINIFLSLLLAQTVFCIESNFIVFYSGVVKVSDGINASGTTVKIQKPGIYLVSGEAEEGNIIVQSNQV
jgi:hypothetical protein